MHKYILKLTHLPTPFDPNDEVTYVTADTPQGLANKFKQYIRMFSFDEEGNPICPMYNVQPMQGAYVDIADWDEFCRVNEVLAE